jgi:hypothetical protein
LKTFSIFKNLHFLGKNKEIKEKRRKKNQKRKKSAEKV